ncbi:MAG: hypothetical protein HOW97_42995, partial [Catenulispora sp.]|nr:hypothetical protein [Catenulispora sp.]
MASTADTADTATDALSEDACEIPAAMRKHVIPRRGTGGEPRAVSPEAARYLAAWLAEHEAAVTAALEDPASEPGLVEEYRACRGDLTAATPRAAAVAGAFAISNDTPAYAAPADVVDAWIGVRGLAFAADATVELFGVAVATSFDGSRITGPQVHHRTADWPVSHEQDLRFELAGRLRAHLATASEPDHARAVEVLTRHRSAAPADDQTRQRLLTAFLLPERTDWVEADLADLAGDHRGTLGAWLAVCALTTADQVASFQSGQRAVWWIVGEPAVLWTGFAGTGNAFLPILSSRLDDMTNPDYVQRLLGVLTCVPSEEALQYLIDNLARKLYPGAALEAAKRFPRRALRLLATAAGHDTPAGRTAAHLLRIHVLAHQDLVRTELDSLDPTARGRVDDLLAAAVRVPDAQTDALPELFVSPPWLSDSGRQPAEPVVIKGLTAPTETVMAWQDGERQEWASRRITDRPDWDDDSLETIAKQIADDGSAHWYANSRFAATAPDALVRSVLPGWRPVSWQADAWVPALVARFGAEALPPVLRLARQHPADCSHLLAPFAAPEAALLAADWLSRLKSARPFALAWLNR